MSGPFCARPLVAWRRECGTAQDGFIFRTGSAPALAALIKRLVLDPNALARLRETMRRPASFDLAVENHVALYRQLMTQQVAADPTTLKSVNNAAPVRCPVRVSAGKQRSRAPRS